MGASAPTAVAMSGGVDSSVAACLLARDSRPIVGFSMQLIDGLAGAEERYGRCCSPEDFRDARQVAEAQRVLFARVEVDQPERMRGRAVTTDPLPQFPGFDVAAQRNVVRHRAGLALVETLLARYNE